MAKAVLFVNPAYHYSFTLRDELRRLGWKADIYKNTMLPKQLLFAEDVLREESIGEGVRWLGFETLKRLWFFIRRILGYRYFVIYGDAEVFTVNRNPRSRLVQWLTAGARSPELRILKLLGKKVLFFPNGCHQELLKKDFGNHENGNVCRNCIVPAAVCNDTENQRIFDLVNRYHDFVIANTPMDSPSLPRKRQLRFLSLDLQQFRQGIEIPDRLKLPKSSRIRILHSFVDEGRQLEEKNVKGSPFVVRAIRRLESEGCPIEYTYLNNVPSRDMRFLQVQADVVVDQLIYGWWGSTAIEGMALGLPVVCYLTPWVKQRFLEAFPEYDGLPIVEATPATIYDVLKRLAEDEPYRLAKGREARAFAERHFDVRKNAPAFAELLGTL